MRLLGRLFETSVAMAKFYQRDAEKLGISLGVFACSRPYANLNRSDRVGMEFRVDSHLQCWLKKANLGSPCRVVDRHRQNSAAQ
jgi:hypothetical protein